MLLRGELLTNKELIEILPDGREKRPEIATTLNRAGALVDDTGFLVSVVGFVCLVGALLIDLSAVSHVIPQVFEDCSCIIISNVISVITASFEEADKNVEL